MSSNAEKRFSCCGCLSNTLVGFCSSLYLILGVSIVAAAASTLFTPLGQIVTPTYAWALIGGGLAIFMIAVIGLCAACDSKQRVRLVHLFNLLTLIMVVLSIAISVAIFQYEDVLKLASRAGGETGERAVAGGIANAQSAIDSAGTSVIKTLATNAFRACDANVSYSSATAYHFTCGNSDFGFMDDTIDAAFVGLNAMGGLNATQGSMFYHCYVAEDGTFPTWPGEDIDGNAIALTSATLLTVLNTPKGLFCACSDVLIDKYILPYLAWAKWVAIAVCVFFLLVLAACIHQICKRGCCGGKKELQDPNDPKALQMSNIQMTYPPPGGNNKKGAQRLNDGGYIARP